MAASFHRVKSSERLKDKNVNIPQSNYRKLFFVAVATAEDNY